MGIGVGIVLIALGAILAFAVSPNTLSGGHAGLGGAIDLGTVGWILMVVGALGVVLSLTLWSSWAGTDRIVRHRRSSHVDGPTDRISRHETIDEF
jgi:hypothetical protein